MECAMHHVNQLDLVWENIVCICIEAQRMTHNIVKNVFAELVLADLGRTPRPVFHIFYLRIRGVPPPPL